MRRFLEWSFLVLVVATFAYGVHNAIVAKVHPACVVCHPSGKFAYWGECE